MKNEKVDYTGVYIVKIDKLNKEIERLNNRIDKALEFIDWTMDNTNMPTNTIVALRTLENILKGVNNE